MKKLIAAAIISSLPLIATAKPANDIAWSQKDANGNVSLNFYVYWSKTCPHCHKALPYIKRMARQHPWIKLHLKEVTADRGNIQDYIRIDKVTGGMARGAVPAFFYCGQAYTGYDNDNTTGRWLYEELKACKANPADFDISF